MRNTERRNTIMDNPNLPAIVDASPHALTAQPDALAPLDYLILLWLHEQASPRTRREYAATLSDFRAALASVGLDMDAGDHNKLAQAAQVWSKRPNRMRGREGGEPSVATTARRYAIVSSFYRFAIRQGMHEWKRDRRTGDVYRDEIEANPLRKVKRPRVERYAEAQAIAQDELIARLRAIERVSLEGKRDYALISVALTTGRRIAELQAMTRGSLTFGRDHRVTVRFVAKGAKTMRDRLGDKTSAALLDYLCAAYQTDDPASLPASAPIWRDTSRPAQWRTQQHGGVLIGLSTSGIRRAFFKRLATSKAHVSRHSFAPLMEKAGASLTDIQARLGHASAKTTADYLNALKSADNPFVDRLEALLGL